MASSRNVLLAAAAWALAALAALATALYAAKVLADVTVPGLYVPVLPELSDGTKVALLWVPTALLLAAWRAARRRNRTHRPAAAADPATPSMGEDGGPIVVAKGLVKIYDTGTVRVEALRGVDLEVRPGEMVAVMGPSGCGKTTLLNCLSGIDDATEGEVYVGGRRLRDLSDNEKTDFRAARMGFIFQAYNLIPVLRVVENVELPLLILGVDPKEARRRATEALKAVGLEAEATRRPNELSGGQQQRVAIARALVNDPEIVFADEPTGNLDSETTQDVIALLRRLNEERGQTFVLVTHDEGVTRIADRVVAMRSGRIEKEYKPTGF
jgi:putative ABC transport system ATP-binding protein